MPVNVSLRSPQENQIRKDLGLLMSNLELTDALHTRERKERDSTVPVPDKEE